MLRSLLEERFKLKIRTETRDLSAYAVTVANGGLKLEKSAIEEKDCPADTDNGDAVCTAKR